MRSLLYLIFFLTFAGPGFHVKSASIHGLDPNANTMHTRFRRAFKSYYYNYYDEMAMSVCASIKSTPGVVFAVRRAAGESRTCQNICTDPELRKQAAKEWQTRDWECIESLHVYKNRPVLAENHGADTDIHKVGLAIYRYQSCTTAGAGPNYCCCSVKYAN